MKTIGLVLVLVACGAEPAERLHTPRRIEPPTSSEPKPFPATLAYPRPTIDIAAYIPDGAVYARWPLGMLDHPALEPHFDIADALAEPGISWTDLCSRGAQHRHMSSKQELVEYLDAWCSVAANDLDAAITKLGTARHAKLAGVLAALKLDVAAITAERGTAHDLESFLRAGGFLTFDEVDAVAAAYAEVGKLDAALEANELAIQLDHEPTEPNRCKRILRAIADTSGDQREGVIHTLRQIAMPPADAGHRPTCVDAYNEVRCWHDDDCAAYWGITQWRDTRGAVVDDSIRLDTLITGYRAWPSAPQIGSAWLATAQHVNAGWPTRDRYQILLPALDLAVRTSECDDRLLEAIDRYATVEEPTVETHLQVNGTPIGIGADGAPKLAGTLEPAQLAEIHDHLASIRTQVATLRGSITSECRTRIAALPPI